MISCWTGNHESWAMDEALVEGGRRTMLQDSPPGPPVRLRVVTCTDVLVVMVALAVLGSGCHLFNLHCTCLLLPSIPGRYLTNTSINTPYIPAGPRLCLVPLPVPSGPSDSASCRQVSRDDDTSFSRSHFVPSWWSLERQRSKHLRNSN